MYRRSFLAAAASGAALAATACAGSVGMPRVAPPPHPELEEATITSLATRMSRGELTAHDLVVAYLERIQAVDRSGPSLRAVLETNPDALAIADALDAERRSR